MLSEPKIIASCDMAGCQATEEFELTTTARGYDERNVDHDLQAAGWRIISENVHWCPSCVEQSEEEEQEDE